jgi:hypothetical protein
MSSAHKWIIAALTVVLVFCAVKTFLLRKHTSRVLQSTVTTALGNEGRLKTDIDSLERIVTARLECTIDPGRDPLNLNTVFGFSSVGAPRPQASEKSSRLRLSCTILSPVKNTAIIKYNSRSFVVHEGEVLHGYAVREITRETVVLQQGGKTTVLHNAPAPNKSPRSRGYEELGDIAL